MAIRQAKPATAYFADDTAEAVGGAGVGGKVTSIGAMVGKSESCSLGAGVAATGARVGPSTGGEPNATHPHGVATPGMTTSWQNVSLNPPSNATWAMAAHVVTPSPGRSTAQIP